MGREQERFLERVASLRAGAGSRGGAPRRPEADGLLLAVHYEHRYVQVVPVAAVDAAACGVEERYVDWHRLQQRAAHLRVAKWMPAMIACRIEASLITAMLLTPHQ